MAKCGQPLEKAPHVCAREARELDGRCCSECSSGSHTPACNILTYPDILSAEYLNNPERESDILGRMAAAVRAAEAVQREVAIVNRLIWDLNMGHQHRTLQSLLHHLEIDLRYINQEIKGIAG